MEVDYGMYSAPYIIEIRFIHFRYFININMRIKTMKWDTPEYSDIRFGFEVTMYINNK